MRSRPSRHGRSALQIEAVTEVLVILSMVEVFSCSFSQRSVDTLTVLFGHGCHFHFSPEKDVELILIA